MASKNKISPARQKALEEYGKERRRIQSLVRNARKRGYHFEENVVPPAPSQLKIQNIPTVTIKARSRQLHEIKPIHLYKQATAVSLESEEIITGTQKLAEVRRESARVRSANQQAIKQERKEHEFIDDIYESQYTGKTIEEVEQEHREAKEKREKWEQRERELADELDKRIKAESNNDEPYKSQESREDFESLKEETPFDAEAQWQAEQRAKDSANIERLNTDKTYSSQFEFGEVVMQGIQQLIDDAMSSGTYKQAGMDLSLELSQQFATYGRDKVILSMANAPEELISEAQIATHYNPGDERHDKAIIRIREIITGEIPSAEELKQMQDRMDADAYTNEP